MLRRGTRSGADGDESTTPSTRRGFGPFTGGQLTTIIVTFAVLLLVPIGAWAVTGSNVFVTDATSGSTAKVDASGSLQTRVKGAVSVSAPTPAIAHGNLVSPTICGAADTCTLVIAPPAGKALIVTSIHLSAWDVPTPGGGERVLFRTSVDGTCNAGSLTDTVDVAHPGGTGDVVLTYSPGLPVQAGRALCAVTNDGALGVDITAWGYTVAPSAVPQ
jgi:hypothetical protein